MKSLKNCIKLACKVTVYVPATTSVNSEIDNTEYINSTASLLSRCFGGATASPAVGYWLSESYGLVRENTTVVFAYAKQADLDKNISDVIDFCENMRNELKQEAIAIEVNGEMYFI